MCCVLLQESLGQRVAELERETRLREETLTNTQQHMTTAQDNLQVQYANSCVHIVAVYIHTVCFSARMHLYHG